METLLSLTKLPPTVIKLILPLGATINMDGTALYGCVAALFLIQIYGIKLLQPRRERGKPLVGNALPE